MALADQRVTFHPDPTPERTMLDDEFLEMTAVLFENEHFALVNARFVDEGKPHVLLFDKLLKRVLTENFAYWRVRFTG